MRGPSAVALLAALLAAVPALGAWEVLRKNDAVSLAIDPASIKRSGDNVSFMYLIDYAKVETDFKAGIAYRSMVVRAQVRCAGRMLAMGNTDVYSESGATGANLGTMFPDRIESSFRRAEAGTSDEDLVKRVCPAAAPKK